MDRKLLMELRAKNKNESTTQMSREGMFLAGGSINVGTLRQYELGMAPEQQDGPGD